MMKPIRFFVYLVCLSTYGCGSSTPAEGEPSKMGGMDDSGCVEKSDCSGELVCVSGTCVLPQCTVDQECSGGLKCVEFRCRFLGETDGGMAPVQPDTDSMVEPPMNPADGGPPIMMDAGVTSVTPGHRLRIQHDDAARRGEARCESIPF